MTTLKCVLPVCMFISLITCYDLGLGDKCGPYLDGKCVLVTNCAIAKKYLMHGHQHGLERCGFSQLTEIVCCPEKIPTPRCIFLRKIVIACEN